MSTSKPAMPGSSFAQMREAALAEAGRLAIWENVDPRQARWMTAFESIVRLIDACTDDPVIMERLKRRREIEERQAAEIAREATP